MKKKNLSPNKNPVNTDNKAAPKLVNNRVTNIINTPPV